MNPENTPDKSPRPTASQQDNFPNPPADPNIPPPNSPISHDTHRTPEHRPTQYHFEPLSHSPQQIRYADPPFPDNDQLNPFNSQPNQFQNFQPVRHFVRNQNQENWGFVVNRVIVEEENANQPFFDRISNALIDILRKWPTLFTLSLILTVFFIGFLYVVSEKGYEAAIPQTNGFAQIPAKWDSFGLDPEEEKPKIVEYKSSKAYKVNPSPPKNAIKTIQIQTNISVSTNITNCSKKNAQNLTVIDVLDQPSRPYPLETNQKTTTENDSDDKKSQSGHSTKFKLEVMHQNTFLGVALKKYSFYEQHIEKIEKQIMTFNINAIKKAKEYDQLPYRYNDKGQLIEWESFKHSLGLKSLDLFPMLDVRQTTPYLFTSYWDLLKISCCSFMVEDKFGWQNLYNMLQGKGPWKSSGSYLTVGSLSYSGFAYKFSDFNLFVPSIIRFVFPSTIQDGSEMLIYGVRMRYDLYRKKQTYVFRELLGKFKLEKTEVEKQNEMAIRRDFYCETVKCQQAFSLVKIISKNRLQVCSLKIQSIYAYDWNEALRR